MTKNCAGSVLVAGQNEPNSDQRDESKPFNFIGFYWFLSAPVSHCGSLLISGSPVRARNGAPLTARLLREHDDTI